MNEELDNKRYKTNPKQVLFAGLAHKLNIYQYIKIHSKDSKKSLSIRSEFLNDFINVRQECYDNVIVDWWEALHEATKYRRKWNFKKAAMYTLCAWEIDRELSTYTDDNIDMIAGLIERCNFKKDIFNNMNRN